MAENIEDNGCSQIDSAEHEGYVKASRSFNRIWKEAAILAIMDESGFTKTDGGYYMQNEELEYHFLYRIIRKGGNFLHFMMWHHPN